jgi:DNA primase
MNNELLQTLIYEDFGYKKEGRNWGRAEEHSSLVVNEEEQKWYWNSEGMGGNSLDYLTKVRGLGIKKAKELVEIKNKIAGIPTDNEHTDSKPYDRLVELFWSLGKLNRDYWYKRGLTDRTIDRHTLGFFKGWSLIPLYSGNSFINFQCRRDEPTRFIKYWYDNDSFRPVLLNKNVLDLVDTIYITEGTVDSLLLNQEGLSSVASTGGSGHWDDSWFPLFYRVKNIIYIADNDNAGKWASNRVAKSLGLDRVRIFTYTQRENKYDTVDYFREGGSVEELKKEIELTSKYHFEIGDYYVRQYFGKRFDRKTKKSHR